MSLIETYKCDQSDCEDTTDTFMTATDGLRVPSNYISVQVIGGPSFITEGRLPTQGQPYWAFSTFACLAAFMSGHLKSDFDGTIISPV